MRKKIECKLILESDGFEGNKKPDKNSARKELARIEYHGEQTELTRELERVENYIQLLKKDHINQRISLEK